MKLSVDVLLPRLEAELGSGAVHADPRTLSRYAVDGKSPVILCLPRNSDQIIAALRVCAEAEAAVIPWGGGRSMGLGNIPRQVDVALGLEDLAGLIEHDDANLTATVQAGMRLAALQEILGRQRQFLAADPPYPARATVGGLVAANADGPRRMLYGSVRDLVIGMKMALATGERIKAGGKVVKNVAGYDLSKLFVGSLGTLGIITEVTFKMAPIPEDFATLLSWGPLAQCLLLVDELSRSALLPASVAILNVEVTRGAGIARGMPVVAVWVEGFRESVSRHLRDLQDMAQRIGLSSDIVRDTAHDLLWDYARDFAASGEGTLYRVTVPLASVAEALTAVERWSASAENVRTIAYAGSGTVWVLLESHPSSAEWFSRLGLLAREQGGHAVMMAAPPALKAGVDVWGAPPPTLPIMKEIKRQFDPLGILNPGRFIAGL